MSLVSDPAVFSVVDPRAKKVEAFDKKTTDAHINAAAERSIPKEVPKLAPITQVDVADATPGHIALIWSPVTDAQDYKLYWDKGDQQQTALFFPVTNSTGGAN